MHDLVYELMANAGVATRLSLEEEYWVCAVGNKTYYDTKAVV